VKVTQFSNHTRNSDLTSSEPISFCMTSESESSTYRGNKWEALQLDAFAPEVLSEVRPNQERSGLLPRHLAYM